MTTGDYNVGIGSSALYSITTKDDNVEVGYNACLRGSGCNNIRHGASAVSSGEGRNFDVTFVA